MPVTLDTPDTVETDYLRIVPLDTDEPAYAVEFRSDPLDDWQEITRQYEAVMPPEVYLRGLADQCRLLASKYEEGKR